MCTLISKHIDEWLPSKRDGKRENDQQLLSLLSLSLFDVCVRVRSWYFSSFENREKEIEKE